jgi:RNA polymerase sigma-70 factor, ECF subfamily
MARFSTGDTDDALDLVQDAMCDFARRYAGRPPEEWGVLFFRVLQSRTTDWHRRTMVRRRFRTWFGSDRDGDDHEDPLQNMPDPGAEDPSEMISRTATAAAIEAAVVRLPLRQRQAFLLRAWEGFDVAQTATAMGCSEGSVKTHYSRAVHTLRTLLEEFRR